MATPFQLSILTPERTVFEGAVEYVQVPGSEGYLGVLAHHAALVTGLQPGTLTVRDGGGREQHWQVSGVLSGLQDEAITNVPYSTAPGGIGFTIVPNTINGTNGTAPNGLIIDAPTR